MTSRTFVRRPERVEAMQLNGPASYQAIAEWVQSLGGKATVHEHGITIDQPSATRPGKDEWVVWFSWEGGGGFFETWTARDFADTFVVADEAMS